MLGADTMPSTNKLRRGKTKIINNATNTEGEAIRSVKLPSIYWKALKEASEDHKRTINQELEWILQQVLKDYLPADEQSKTTEKSLNTYNVEL